MDTKRLFLFSLTSLHQIVLKDVITVEEQIHEGPIALFFDMKKIKKTLSS